MHRRLLVAANLPSQKRGPFSITSLIILAAYRSGPRPQPRQCGIVVVLTTAM
jgi:hypothetical protein